MSSTAVILSALALSLLSNFLLITWLRKKNTPGKVLEIGGVAIILSFWVVSLIFGLIPTAQIIPLSVASVIILVGGIADYKFSLGPIPQLIIQFIAAFIAVVAGNIVINYVTNPFGGLWYLNNLKLANISLVAAIVSIIWIVALMNIINWLDGTDGLAGSLSLIGFVSIGLVSLLPQVNDPVTALISFSVAGIILGFLFWNYPPAVIYLGTVGSWFLGFLLAILAIQGVTKIATTIVVGAIPVLDALVVVLGRIKRGKSPLQGDKTHMHHRLLKLGFSQRSILLLYVLISLLLGAMAVFLQTHEKAIVFLTFGLMFVVLSGLSSLISARRGAIKAKIDD